MATQNRVSEVRQTEAISKAELARRSGIAERTLRRVEEARRNVSPNTRAKIVKGLNAVSNKKPEYTLDYVFPNN